MYCPFTRAAGIAKDCLKESCGIWDKRRQCCGMRCSGAVEYHDLYSLIVIQDKEIAEIKRQLDQLPRGNE